MIQSRLRSGCEEGAAEHAGHGGGGGVGLDATVAEHVAIPRGGRDFDDLSDIVLVGYDLATDVLPSPPPAGEAVVDARLAEILGLSDGDRIALGPTEVEVEVVELVADITAGSPTIWVSSDRWLELAAEVAPSAPPVLQAAVVELADGATTEDLAGLVEGVEVGTVEQVIDANDVVTQQAATFQGIIAVTFVVTLLVVALFFVLLTIERVRLYAVLKAVGGRTRDLVTGLTLQAVVVAAAAVVVGFALAFGALALVPPELPIVVTSSRLGVIAVTTVVVAVLGALTTLRRVLAVDPADAIG